MSYEFVQLLMALDAMDVLFRDVEPFAVPLLLTIVVVLTAITAGVVELTFLSSFSPLLSTSFFPSLGQINVPKIYC